MKRFYEAKATTVSGKKIQVTAFMAKPEEAYGIAYVRAKTTTKNFELDPIKLIDVYEVR